LAKALAPEEIRSGDYVTPLDEIAELPSFLWCADATIVPHDQPVRIRFTSPSGGVPLKVKSVCLPFVLVRHPQGERRMLDVRKCRLARLDRTHARAAWKAIRQQRPNR
jgi:hypothetical protein